MITFINSIFDAKGSDKKAKVFGLTLSGAEDVLIKDCEFTNIGYSSILNNSTGNVTIEGCKFNCANVYNPVEGSQAVNNGNVIVKDCEFVGAPGNNYINFYQFANGAKNAVTNCRFNPTVDNNVIRISNRTNAIMNLKIEDCHYDFADGDAHDYTGLILCQDYTNKNGTKQDFTHVAVELNNVFCNGEKVTTDGAAKGSIFYVYEDGAGIITGSNDPFVVIK